MESTKDTLTQLPHRAVIVATKQAEFYPASLKHVFPGWLVEPARHAFTCIQRSFADLYRVVQCISTPHTPAAKGGDNVLSAATSPPLDFYILDHPQAQVVQIDVGGNTAFLPTAYRPNFKRGFSYSEASFNNHQVFNVLLVLLRIC